MMKPTIFAVAMLIAGAAQAADGKIAAACKAQDLMGAEGCACLQGVADENLREGLHELVAEYLGRKVDIAVIAAERGHSGAEALYDAHAAFHKKAEAACEMPELAG